MSGPRGLLPCLLAVLLTASSMASQPAPASWPSAARDHKPRMRFAARFVTSSSSTLRPGFDASKWDLKPSGLPGPVRLIPLRTIRP